MEKTHPLLEDESAAREDPLGLDRPDCGGHWAEGDNCGHCPKCRSVVAHLMKPPAACKGTLSGGDYCGACPKCRSEIGFLVRRMQRLTAGGPGAEPRGLCGMRNHFADCDCEGAGGGR